MLFPVYVHKGDEKHAHGAELPDFPGCFSAADTWSDLPRKIQEAVELCCEDEEMMIPSPTPLDDLLENPDYEGGVWMMMDINLTTLKTKSV
ncbi:HicB-like antitoxin of HicAB toxin-antitoxin system [Tamilnaduibacter salinus]|uniref:HicB-like antitoxin of HicAB toxin-antitoxin system n=1 Tax=Tamilnaduibacter salinus TaxID=1484056 RepID=A0A2U1D1A7_9GAMM|nr:type II toxin-antitoxin system HicB family antitoxin [Tamilnaduibacter salinus]PVY79154.1 HicB-like antitoxin of HicAB toxin-antitoxin system [Tamilnaduibacter salinus]